METSQALVCCPFLGNVTQDASVSGIVPLVVEPSGNGLHEFQVYAAAPVAAGRETINAARKDNAILAS